MSSQRPGSDFGMGGGTPLLVMSVEYTYRPEPRSADTGFDSSTSSPLIQRNTLTGSSGCSSPATSYTVLGPRLTFASPVAWPVQATLPEVAGMDRSRRDPWSWCPPAAASAQPTQAKRRGTAKYKHAHRETFDERGRHGGRRYLTDHSDATRRATGKTTRFFVARNERAN